MRVYSFFALKALFLLMLVESPSSSQTSDPRIIEKEYRVDSVYHISISSGRASVVEFERDEAIESVIVGDSSNWLVETTASANRVVIKPGNNANTTNMIVVTTKRTYTFILDSYGEKDVYVLRFNYAPTENINTSQYALKGHKSLYPRLISDNGQSTSIYWPKKAKLPAIFIIDDNGDEVIANYRSAGDGLVIDGVYDQYIFRSGKRKATAKRQLVKGRRQ